jgi:hypothetical protein
MKPKRAVRWCPLCDGFGGWDKNSYKARFREKFDTSNTYMPCIWCSLSNVIRKVV